MLLLSCLVRSNTTSPDRALRELVRLDSSFLLDKEAAGTANFESDDELVVELLVEETARRSVVVVVVLLSSPCIQAG